MQRNCSSLRCSSVFTKSTGFYDEKMLLYLSAFLLLISPCLSFFMDNSSRIVEFDTDLKLQCNLSNTTLQENNIVWKSPQKKKDGSTANIKYGGRTQIIRSLKFEDTGKYECEYNGEKAWKTIVVGKSPDQATDFSCTTHYSLNHMKCCWNVGNVTGIPTNYSLHYITRTRYLWINLHHGAENPGHDIVGCCVMKQNDSFNVINRMHCCDLQLPDISENRNEITLASTIQLISKNALGVVISQNFTENPFAWVKPPAPQNLTSAVKKETNVYIMKTAWNSPNMILKLFEYRIRYRLAIGLAYGEWRVLKGITKKYYSIVIPRSHSLVEVQVAARPSGNFGGDWSDWSESVFNSTGIIPPTSTLRFQKVVSDISDGVLTITTQWIEYGRSDEPGFHYKIIYEECSGALIATMNVGKNRTIYKKELNVTTCVKITGLHCNAIGCSDNTSIKVFPSQASKYNATVYLDVSKSKLQAKWDFEDHGKLSETCVVNIYEIHRTREHNYTHTTQMLIAKRNVSCMDRKFIFSKPPSLCREYICTLSSIYKADRVTYTATFKSKSEILKFENIPKIGLLQVHSDEQNKINLSWHAQRLNCSYLLPRISYKPVNGSECYPNKSTCGGEFVSEALNCDAQSGTITRNVYGDTMYRVHMTLCCPRETYLKTNRPICFNNENNDVKHVRSIATESEAPTNFTWNENHSALYWDPPYHSNGPITGYIVSISSPDDDTKIRNVTTVHRKVTFDEICIKYTQETSLQIRAFNARKNDGDILYGKPGPNISIDCSARKAIHRDSVPVIAGSIVGIFLVIVGAMLTYYYKRTVKNILVRALWPSVPQPAITVAFQLTDEDIDLVNAENNTQERSSRTNRREEYYDEIQYPLLSNSQSESVHHDIVIVDEVENTQQQEPSRKENERNSAVDHDNVVLKDNVDSSEQDANREENSSDDRAVPRKERRHSCGDTTVQQLNKITDKIATPYERSYIKTAQTPLEVADTQQFYNSSSRYRTNSYYGSTPSLPSYLTCSTAYPFSIHTSPERSDLGSIYARMPDLYKWTMPDYTTFLTDNQSCSLNEIPQTSDQLDWKTSTPRVMLGDRDENKIFTVVPPLPGYTCFAPNN